MGDQTKGPYRTAATMATKKMAARNGLENLMASQALSSKGFRGDASTMPLFILAERSVEPTS